MEYLKNILTMELKSECEYLNDKKYGEIKEYYEKGQLKLKVNIQLIKKEENLKNIYKWQKNWN